MQGLIWSHFSIVHFLLIFLLALQSSVEAADDTCKPQEYLAGRNLERLSCPSLLHDYLGHSCQLRLQVHHISTEELWFGFGFLHNTSHVWGLIGLEMMGVTDEGNRLVVF